MSNEVELHPATVFDCEQCGKENFKRLVVREFDTEQLEQMRDEHGIQPYEAGEWVECPTVVVCQYCGKTFDVASAGF